MYEKLILPPFGKILLAYQEQAVRRSYTVYIHVGKESKEHCYCDIDSGSLASFIPDDLPVTAYKWPINNRHVVVVDHGDMSLPDLQKICLYLLVFKPKIIYLWSEKHPCQFFKGNNTNEH